MNRRTRVLLLVTLAILIGSVLAVEVDAAKWMEFVSPGKYPYADYIMGIYNYSDKQLNLTVTSKGPEGQECYVYYDGCPANDFCSTWVTIWDCENCGATSVYVENTDMENGSSDWDIYVYWYIPCP